MLKNLKFIVAIVAAMLLIGVIFVDGYAKEMAVNRCTNEEYLHPGTNYEVIKTSAFHYTVVKVK